MIDCSLSVASGGGGGRGGGGGIVVYEKSFQGMNHLIIMNIFDPAASLRDSFMKTIFKYSYVRCYFALTKLSIIIASTDKRVRIRQGFDGKISSGISPCKKSTEDDNTPDYFESEMSIYKPQSEMSIYKP